MSRFDEKAQDWDTEERQERARMVAQVIREQVPLTRDDAGHRHRRRHRPARPGPGARRGLGASWPSRPPACWRSRGGSSRAGSRQRHRHRARPAGRPARRSTLRPRRLHARAPSRRGHGRGAALHPCAARRPTVGSPSSTSTPRTARSMTTAPRASTTRASTRRRWWSWRARPGSRTSRRASSRRSSGTVGPTRVFLLTGRTR